MGFKVKLEIDPEGEEEVIIRCKGLTEEILGLEAYLNNATSKVLELHIGNDEYFISTDELLFFETSNDKVTAHSRDKMYYTDLKLYELEERLPKSFMRVSKACILNLNAVSSLSRDITGICEVHFRNTIKKVYVSRGYYKLFREKLNEMRLKR